MTGPLLRVSDLTATVTTRREVIQAVRGISFDINADEAVGFVGESGCGKSVTAKALMRLAPEGASLQLAERGSEEPIIPITVAAATLQPITVDSVTVIAGPQASTGMRERLAFVAAREAATRTKPS